ncbi:MAG: hypothetical protein AAFW69_12570, partial [Pseudomonadota bacterium]
MTLTRLAKAATVGAVLAILAACAPVNPAQPVESAVANAQQAAALAQSIAAEGDVTAVGTFIGDSDHVTIGSAAISRTEDGRWLVTLGDDFSLDGAPDPKVALGTP